MSCDPIGNIPPPHLSNKVQELISKDEAIDIVMKFLRKNNRVNSSTASIKNISFDITEIKGTHGEVALYIFNNFEGGWEIIAGTKVEEPILAFGIDNFFDADINKMNVGLQMWLANTIEQMVKAYYYPDEYKANITLYSATSSRIIEPDPEECVETRVEVDPLVVDANGNEVQFGQHYPENYYYKSCGTFNAPAGCVPIAMAQMMWYYQSPSNYNWNLIPRNPTAGNNAEELATGNLVWDIKEALEPWIWVTCDKGTGALTDTFDNLDKSFDVFGYDAYKFTAASTITYELDRNRPIMAVGGNTIEEGRHVGLLMVILKQNFVLAAILI